MAVVEADVELAAGRDGELAVDSNLKMVPEIKMEQVASPLMQVCNFFRPIATKRKNHTGRSKTNSNETRVTLPNIFPTFVS